MTQKLITEKRTQMWLCSIQLVSNHIVESVSCTLIGLSWAWQFPQYYQETGSNILISVSVLRLIRFHFIKV